MKKAKIIRVLALITVILTVFPLMISCAPYSTVNISKYIDIADYFKREISEAEFKEEFDESKASLIAKFSEKKNLTGDIVIAEGMNVVVKIEGYLNGEKIKDISYDSYEIADIGSHEAAKDEELFKALEKHMLGRRYESEQVKFDNKAPDFMYTYPDDYSVTKVKGKEVTHKIQILGVTETIEPEYNDEFFVTNRDAINDYLGLSMSFNTVQEFETYMSEQIKLNILWNDIVDNSTVKEYPEKYIKKYEKEFDDYYEAYMEAYDITFSELLSYLGTNEDGYNEKRTEYAQGIVKEELILYHIVKEKNIKVSSAEYKKRALALAKDGGYGDTVKDFEEAVGKDVAERTVLWEKTKEYLLENAVWVGSAD